MQHPRTRHEGHAQRVPPCPCAAHDRRYFQGSRLPPPGAISTTNSTLFHPARVLLGLMVAVALLHKQVEQVRAVCASDCHLRELRPQRALRARDAIYTPPQVIGI